MTGDNHLASVSADLDCATTPGSVSFPADGPQGIAVGTVNYGEQRLGYRRVKCGLSKVVRR